MQSGQDFYTCTCSSEQNLFCRVVSLSWQTQVFVNSFLSHITGTGAILGELERVDA